MLTIKKFDIETDKGKRMNDTLCKFYHIADKDYINYLLTLEQIRKIAAKQIIDENVLMLYFTLEVNNSREL